MQCFPSPSLLYRLLFCLGFALVTLPIQAAEDPLRPGDIIDVTLASGAVFEYAKVIDVMPDSIMVANPQGVREFAAKSLSADLRARLPGAKPEAVATPAPAPTPPSPPAAVAKPEVTMADLDALAKILQDKIGALQSSPEVIAAPAPAEPVSANNSFVEALIIGLLLIIPTLNVLATRSVILHVSGSAVPVWVLVIWLIPLIGSITAFAALGRDVSVKKS